MCMEDSTEINYAEIRKQMHQGAWPAPYFFKAALCSISVLYTEIL